MAKIQLWFNSETAAAYRYCKLPPERNPQAEDYVWIPKSQVEHRSKEPGGRHIVTIPDWLAEVKGL